MPPHCVDHPGQSLGSTQLEITIGRLLAHVLTSSTTADIHGHAAVLLHPERNTLRLVHTLWQLRFIPGGASHAWPPMLTASPLPLVVSGFTAVTHLMQKPHDCVDPHSRTPCHSAAGPCADFRACAEVLARSRSDNLHGFRRGRRVRLPCDACGPGRNRDPPHLAPGKWIIRKSAMFSDRLFHT